MKSQMNRMFATNSTPRAKIEAMHAHIHSHIVPLARITHSLTHSLITVVNIARNRLSCKELYAIAITNGTQHIYLLQSESQSFRS